MNLLIRKADRQDLETIIQFNINMAKETEDMDLPKEKISPGVYGLYEHPQYGFYVVAEVEHEMGDRNRDLVVGSGDTTGERSGADRAVFNGTITDAVGSGLALGGTGTGAGTGSRVIAATLMITYEWTDWRNGLFWWVQSVYVSKPFRRRGIYTAMYKWVKQQAQSDHVTVGMRLYVEKDNLPAQKTYQAMGMKETVYRLFQEDFVKKGPME